MHVYSQESANDRLVRFARNAALFSINYAQEKAYLHFDNTGYFLGETIWFKAYVVNALNNSPSDMSKTLYVELLTQEGDLLEGKKVKLSNGVGSGDFFLPDSLPGGYYEVRAYTRSMLNFGDEVVFSRVFPVYSAPNVVGDFTQRVMNNRLYKMASLRKPLVDKSKVNLAFYPEGGTLIRGVKTNIAFKATDSQGKSLDVKGSIFDSSDKKLCDFKTLHDGMGLFSICVDSGEVIAKLEDDGADFEFPLPPAERLGYHLSLNPFVDSKIEPDSLVVRVDKSKLLIGGDSLALVVSCRGKLLEFRVLTIPSEGIEFGMKTKILQAGVNQFTLYDSEGRVVGERLLFVRSNKAKVAVAELQVKMDKQQYKPFERIQLTLLAKDTLSTKSGTSISIAVRDASLSNFGNPDKSTIQTNLLLSSDLKGYISNPDWYFESNDFKHRQGADLLMLTQGWRRYKWQRMSGVELFTPKHPIEDGIVIDGEVRSVFRKKPVRDVDLRMWMIQGANSLQGSTQTDSLGYFSFILQDIADTWQLNIKTTVEEKTKDFRILLNRQFSPKPKALIGYEKEVLSDDMQDAVLTTSDSISSILGRRDASKVLSQSFDPNSNDVVLKEFVRTADKKISFVQDMTRKASVNIAVDKALDVVQDLGQTETSSIVDFLERTNTQFNFNTKIVLDPNGKPIFVERYIFKSRVVRFRYYANDLDTKDGSTTLYQVESGSTICNPPSGELLIQDLDKILIVEESGMMGKIEPELYFSAEKNNELDPVYVFLFLKKNFQPIILGLRSTPFQGYTYSKEFYSPTYISGEPVLDPDHRRTLYWNSEVVLSKNGTAQVVFFNNKTCKQLIVSAEGITGKGILLKNE